MLSDNFTEMTTSTQFRDLLHAANLRHGTDGFTSPPKEGVLRIFSPLKIRLLRPGLNPRTWVVQGSTLPLDHRTYSPKILRSFCSISFHFRVHNRPQLVIFRQMNPFYVPDYFPLRFFPILSFHLSLCLQSRLLPSLLPTKTLHALPFAFKHDSPLLQIRCGHPNNNRTRAQKVNRSTMRFSPAAFLLGYNIFFSNQLCKRVQLLHINYLARQFYITISSVEGNTDTLFCKCHGNT